VSSADGGATWFEARVIPAAGLGREWKTRIYGELAGVAPNPQDPREAVAYGLAALWKSTDGGATFADSSTGFTGFAWNWWNHGIAFDRFDPDRFATFNCDVSMVVTENGGDWFTRRRIPWEWYQQGIVSWVGMHAGDFQPIPGSQVIVGSAGLYWDTKLVRSADGGRTWVIVDGRSENNLFIAFHPDDPDLVYAGNKRSLDGGRSFAIIDALTSSNASIVGMCRARADTIYAMGKPRSTLLRSDDRGETWRVYASVDWTFNGMDSKPTFVADPVDPDTIYTLDRDGDLAVFDGRSWRATGVLARAGGEALGNFVRSVTVDPRHPEILYAVMDAAGLPYVWRSTDAGFTWEDVTYNLSRTGGGAIAVSPHTGEVFHGSHYGTWVLPPPYRP
jgi:hypothetical protein